MLPSNLLDLFTDHKENESPRMNWQAGGSFQAVLQSASDSASVTMQVTVVNQEPPCYHVRFRSEGVTELPGSPMHIKDTELLNAISAQIAVVDSQGMVRAVNDAWTRFARMNGAPPGENFIGYNYLEICSNATGEGAEQAIQVGEGLSKVLSGEQKEFELEYPCHAPGERRWFVLRITAIPGDKGAVITHINVTSQKLMQRMMQGMNRDLEERFSRRTLELENESSVRRLMEEEARSREEQLEALVSAVPDYVWTFLVAPNGRASMELQSPSVESITGYPPDFFQEGPEKWMELVLEEDRDQVDRNLKDVIAGLKESVRLEFRIRNKSGEIRWLNSHIRAMDRKSWGTRIVGVTADITVRRQAEEDLKSHSQFIEKAAASLPGILFVRNLARNATTYMSRSAAPEFGADISPFGAGIHPEDRKTVESKAASIPGLQDGEVCQFTYRVRSTAGRWRWILARCAPFRREEPALAEEMQRPGKLVEVLGYLEDVTEQKEASAGMQQARKDLENAMKTRDRFIANISHEIRTPIFAILGVADLLLKKSDDAEVNKHLNIVRGSGDTLLQLLNDIIEFSRLESGDIKPEKVSFSLQEEMEGVLEPYRYRATEKGLSFEVHISDRIPALIESDPLRLKQIVTNLVSNSVKFTEEGRVQVDFQVNHEYGISGWQDSPQMNLEIVVSDSGIGIEEQKQELIFEVFRQSDESINRRFGGSGLGLSIVRHLVSLLGGSIDLKSPSERIREEHPGSDFIVRIPVTPAKSAPGRRPSAEALDTYFPSGLRVLLAEDNEVNRMLLERFLQDMNCIAVSVSNGLEALRMLDRDREFDAILMDVNMPEMGGFEATRRIRASDIEIPVIGITADVFKEDVERCLESGMNDHLGKPVWPEDLFRKLKHWVPDEN